MSGFRIEFVFDLNSSLVLAKGQEFVWESLVDRKVGSSYIDTVVAHEIPEKTDEPRDISDKRQQLKEKFSSEQLLRYRSSGFLSDDKLSRLGFLSDDELSNQANNGKQLWHLGGPIQLSHYCSWDRAVSPPKCQASTGDAAEAKEEIAERRALQVTHQPRSLTSQNFSTSSMLGAEERTTVTRGLLQRSLINLDHELDLWQRLQSFGFDVWDLSRVNAVAVKPKSYDGTEVAKRIIQSLPSAAARFKTELDDNDSYGRGEQEATLTDPSWVEDAWSLPGGHRPFWLIHSYYSYGASSREFLYLLRDDGKDGSRLVDLTSRLRYKVGHLPSGLAPDGQIEETEDRASTYGFGGWPATVDKVSVSFGRYLIASGTWLTAGLQWLLVYDLETDQILMFNRDLPEGTTVLDYAITRDGKQVVQAHSDGELYFYDVGSGMEVLRGFDIDGEIVIYDVNGYYASTPDGAEYVFLKFPGQPGYKSLRQFGKLLNRPDIISGELKNALRSSDPDLKPPPTVRMDMVADDAPQAGKFALRIDASSDLGLRAANCFWMVG